MGARLLPGPSCIDVDVDIVTGDIVLQWEWFFDRGIHFKRTPNMHILCKFVNCSSNSLEFIARISRISHNSSHNGQNYVEGQGQWLPFSIPAVSISGCMFGANLLILDQICDELSCWKGKSLRTDADGQTHCHAGHDNTQSAWKVKG